MAAADSIPYTRGEDPKVFAFRVRVDRETNEKLATELVERARILRETPELPADKRRPYDEVVDLVLGFASYRGPDAWRAGRLARRVWTTGECLLHAYFVLFGSQTGSGCECSPCRDRRGQS